MLHSTPSWFYALYHRSHPSLLDSSRSRFPHLVPPITTIQYSPCWRPLLGASLVALLVFAWQVATPRTLWAADAIALSDEWLFVDESKPGAPILTGELVGATDSPTEVAARFHISSTMQALALQLHDNTLSALPLAQVEELSYCTRLIDGPRPYAVTLQLNIDADVTDGENGWQGRLVYTPSHNGAVIQGEWQCWNTLVGKWWATGGPLTEVAPASSPLPLGTLLAHYPNLGINGTYTAVVLKAGDGWSNFVGEASPVIIGVEGERISMAFGVAPLPVPEEVAQEDNTQADTTQAEGGGQEILLPVLVNESQTPTEDNPGNGRKIDWRNVDWENFEWDQVDWSKLDWEQSEWSALLWGGLNLNGFVNVEVNSEDVRSFIADVRQCKDRGWETLGFDEPGLCVAHFVEAHTPSYTEWNSWGVRRQWNARNHRWNDSGDDDKKDDRQENQRQRRGRR